MADPPKNDAVGGDEFNSWPELVQHLLEEHILTGRVYRGMRDARFRCVTSLERAFDDNLYPLSEEARSRLEQSTISEFRALAHSQLTELPGTDDFLGWLTVMQHYGAPTRLLDWTSSPFVACYFAYRDMSDDQEHPAALWSLWAKAAHVAIQEDVLMDLVPRDDISQTFDGVQRDDWLRQQNTYIRLVIGAGGVRQPFPVMPENPDARMVAQQTVLTVDTMLDGGVTHSENGATSPFVERILLPAQWREEVLTGLGTMGITGASLFPGLEGIGEYVSTTLRMGQTFMRTGLQHE